MCMCESVRSVGVLTRAFAYPYCWELFLLFWRRINRLLAGWSTQINRVKFRNNSIGERRRTGKPCNHSTHTTHFSHGTVHASHTHTQTLASPAQRRIVFAAAQSSRRRMRGYETNVRKDTRIMNENVLQTHKIESKPQWFACRQISPRFGFYDSFRNADNF